jgi:signal transduction histidine kinase
MRKDAPTVHDPKGARIPLPGQDERPHSAFCMSFRCAILRVVLTCSLLGVGLSLSIYWNYSRLRLIEESGQANVAYVEYCQRDASSSAGVALNIIDLLLLDGVEQISSYHLEAILSNAKDNNAELEKSIAGRGLTEAVESIAPESKNLHAQAREHLSCLQEIERLTTDVMALCRTAAIVNGNPTSLERAQAEGLADELVHAIEGSNDAASVLSTALGGWMEQRQTRQARLAILCSVLYVLLVAYLMIWTARQIAQPIERMERALDKSVTQASSDLDFKSFKEINALRDSLVALLTLRDSREEDLEIEVQNKVNALLRREQEVQHLQRIEQLGGLAGSVAHDFRNLLTVISGYAGLVAADDGATDSVRENIDEVLTATRRATALTTKLLAFSKQEEVGAAPSLSINEWVENCGVLLSPFGGPAGTTLELECAPDLPNLPISRVSFDQILMNLVGNAREALVDGKGHIEVRLGKFNADAHGLRPKSLAEVSALVAVQVHDNGMGIPEESQERIFERYYSTKKGTGFGLATVREIVVGAGGTIRVESTVGVGTTFTLLLPGIEAAATKPSPA